MTESSTDRDFWGPDDAFSDPNLDLPAGDADPRLVVPEPILDLPEAPSTPGLGLEPPVLDLPEVMVEPSASSTDLTDLADPWAGVEERGPQLDLSDAEPIQALDDRPSAADSGWPSDPDTNHSLLIDLPPGDTESATDGSPPILLELPDVASDAAAAQFGPLDLDLPERTELPADQSPPILIDLPDSASDAAVARFDPLGFDIPPRDPDAAVGLGHPLDPMVLDLPELPGDVDAAADFGRDADGIADLGRDAGPPDPAPGPFSPSVDLELPESEPVTPEPALDLRLSAPPATATAPEASTLPAVDAVAGGLPAEKHTSYTGLPPVPRSSRIGPIVPAAPPWSRREARGGSGRSGYGSRDGRTPKVVAAGLAAVAVVVGAMFVIRGGNGGSGDDSSRLVSAPPPAAPASRPKIPGSISPPPATPAAPAAPDAGVLGPPAPAKPAGSAPAAPASSGPGAVGTPSSSGRIADPGTDAESAPSVDEGSSGTDAPADAPPSAGRPPVDLSGLFPPPPPPPPPPVVTPPPSEPPPPVSPPTTPPPSRSDVCRNVPAASLDECLNAIG